MNQWIGESVSTYIGGSDGTASGWSGGSGIGSMAVTVTVFAVAICGGDGGEDTVSALSDPEGVRFNEGALRLSDDEQLIGFGGGRMVGDTASDWFRPLGRWLFGGRSSSWFNLTARGLVGNLVGDNLVFRALSFLFFRGGDPKLSLSPLRFLGITLLVLW